MSLAPWVLEYRKYDLSEPDPKKYFSAPKVVKGAYQTLLKEEFKKIRDKDTIMVDPNLKNGEVMAFESKSYRHVFIIWDIYYDKTELLSKKDMDLFTDLVLDTRKFESEYIGQQMLEEDPVYQMLKHSPTIQEVQQNKAKGASSGYVFASK